MRRPRRFESTLIWPIGMLGIALTLSCFLVLAGIQQCSAAKNTLENAQNLLAANQHHLQDVHLEQAAMEANTRTFLRWQEQGLIGKENRLAWIDALQKNARTLGMRDIRIKFDTHQPFGNPSAAEMRWYVSTLHLSMNGIDEVRLLRLLKSLASEAMAELIIRRCDLKLAEKPADGTDDGPPSLNAECTIDWLTIDQTAERA